MIPEYLEVGMEAVRGGIILPLLLFPVVFSLKWKPEDAT
jgi:hypothetical protein